ncbi:MAG: YqeG family HAD IIIA-type phosphatase [Oscillospiraceae bacterium]|nr:YqeG family HAD IIIA-type phosphatase [Oscillospiraceae bacterium]
MSKGFVPDHRLRSVGEINESYLKKRKIGGLIVDLDNTLALPDDMEPTGEARGFATRMKRAGIPVIVVSNNSEPRVAGFCAKLGFDYVFKSGKPFGTGINRAIKKTGLPRTRIALVGDQLITDVLAASVNGIRCILTDPIVLEEGFFFRLKRGFETLIDINRKRLIDLNGRKLHVRRKLKRHRRRAGRSYI